MKKYIGILFMAMAVTLTTLSGGESTEISSSDPIWPPASLEQTVVHSDPIWPPASLEQTVSNSDPIWPPAA
ncbi:hypothetical protein [Bacillus sp. FJAT-45037]|uniref:hypothetical protein n=1 Tax=Bacillus sp. FJAT-45037 TaxID=2011007 RepID=UPI000C23C74A|nr:hypothetical protein [Bacillus sp. FJAT-45037]